MRKIIHMVSMLTPQLLLHTAEEDALHDLLLGT